MEAQRKKHKDWTWCDARQTRCTMWWSYAIIRRRRHPMISATLRTGGSATWRSNFLGKKKPLTSRSTQSSSTGLFNKLTCAVVCLLTGNRTLSGNRFVEYMGEATKSKIAMGVVKFLPLWLAKIVIKLGVIDWFIPYSKWASRSIQSVLEVYEILTVLISWEKWLEGKWT